MSALDEMQEEPDEDTEESRGTGRTGDRAYTN